MNISESHGSRSLSELVDPEEQPRDKSNDKDHVNDLLNSYEVQGYLIGAHPPMGSVFPNQLSGQS